MGDVPIKPWALELESHKYWEEIGKLGVEELIQGGRRMEGMIAEVVVKLDRPHGKNYNIGDVVLKAWVTKRANPDLLPNRE